jgi:hypothetical protein
MEPLFKTSVFGTKAEVYANFIKYSQMWGTAGKQTIMLNQIASIETGMPGLQQVKVETTGGKVYKLVIRLKDKDSFVNAVHEAMSKK